MIRLALLLLGAGPLRGAWWAFIALSVCSFLLGIVFIGHLLDGATFFTTDVIGVALIIEGSIRLLRLAALGFPNATKGVLKSLGFFALGFLIIDVPWDDNIVATVTFGTALAIDGVFRLVAAMLIRSVRWRQAVLAGLIELVVAGLVWSTWPIPHRRTVPFCLGVALLAAAWSLCRLGLGLRRLPPGASVTDLPLFAGPNWHRRGVPGPTQTQTATWHNAAPLLIHVWTPVGQEPRAPRRLIVDRYIAAVDQGGVISTGHAAMSVPPGTYISLCPAIEVDRAPSEFGSMLRASVENDVPGRFRPSFAAECADWRAPDRELAFGVYNAPALLAFLEDYQKTPIYNLTSRNCSSTVALSLDAAVEGVLGQRRPWLTLLLLLTDPAMWLLSLWRARAEAMTWTPGLILDYAETLRFVIEGHRERWFIRLWNVRRRFDNHRRTEIADGEPTRSRFPAMVSIVLTAMIFGLTYGLSAPLLALSLRQHGYSESFIGANAAMHAVGVLAIAPFLAGVAWRTGPKLPIAVALLVAAASLALFPMMPSIWLWFPLRIALGAAAETLFVMSETWLSQLSDEGSRARTMAIYITAMSLGFALGPIILALVGTEGPWPYLIGAGVALLALLSIAMPWVRTAKFERPSHGNPLRYLALAPIAVGATLLNSGIETAGMSFLPLYAMRLGWGEQPATLLLSVLLLGAIMLQLPIGWLGDRMDRRKLVIALGIASAAGALAWPLVLNTAWLAYPLLFVWGGVFVGIYTIMMAVVGSRFNGGNLVSVYAVMSLAWGAGAFIGPSTAGAALDLARHGLPVFAATACIAFTVLAISRRTCV